MKKKKRKSREGQAEPAVSPTLYGPFAPFFETGVEGPDGISPVPFMART
jgi:hypothetical protein